MYCLVIQTPGKVEKQSKMQDSVKLGEDSRQRNASMGDNIGIRNSWKCFIS